MSSDIRYDIFIDRYALKDEHGNPIETHPEQMWQRVAKAVAACERDQTFWTQTFFSLLKDYKFVPGGRILAGAGTNTNLTWYNCFFIPMESVDPSFGRDSRDSILDTLKRAVEITSHGGGVGINFSALRPRGAYIKGVNGKSSGSVSWMEAYNGTLAQVSQGGSRRAASMFILDVWHPDIEEFITVKRDLNRLHFANLSVNVSDRFMEAVRAGEDWSLVFPDTDDPQYNETWNGRIDEYKGKKRVYKIVPARKLWRQIAESAWACGEPGVLFLDRAQRLSNTYYRDRIAGCNPCGEVVLPEWGVCNLGAINLMAFVKDGAIDRSGLAQVIFTAVRFLDDVIDTTPYAFEQNKKEQAKVRRIGLGTMGLADVLLVLGIRYGSAQAVEFVRDLYAFICRAAYHASVEIAKEKGPAPAFEKDKFLNSEFVKRLPKALQAQIATHGIRNLNLLSQAPTGTISLLAGCSSGIEPVFQFKYKVKSRLGEHEIVHPLYREPLPDHFVTALDLSPEEHVRMQAAIQEFTDLSISKTVNAPSTHTVEDTMKIFDLAYDLGCKGITYFRSGCREGVLVTSEKSGDQNRPKLKPRPSVLVGKTYRQVTPLGTAFVTVNRDGKEPFEVFVNIGKAGSDVAGIAEALGRLISLCLRLPSEMPPSERLAEIISQLDSIGGSTSVGLGPEKVRSLADAIARVLEQDTPAYTEQPSVLELCPNCGNNTLSRTGHCAVCVGCGYTLCQ